MKLEVILMKKFLFAFTIVALLASFNYSATGHAEDGIGGFTTQELPSVH